MTYAATILADNPVAYWRLDEASGTVAHDLTSNGDNGTLVGTITYSQAGAIIGDSDTSMLFGATSTLSLPYTLNVSTWSAASLEYWINITSGWQYVVVTTSNITGQTLLYLNGAVYTSGSGDPIVIDTDIYYAGSYASSDLDEVALYNYVLSQAQIYFHYLIGMATRSLPTPVALGVSGLLGSGPVLPCTSLPPYYIVNGAVLDSQPSVFTAPQVQNGMIPAGSTFVLIFELPSVYTMLALANGSTVTMRFRLSNDAPVSGQVSLASTLTSTVFQVVVTVLQTIQVPLPSYPSHPILV